MEKGVFLLLLATLMLPGTVLSLYVRRTFSTGTSTINASADLRTATSTNACEAPSSQSPTTSSQTQQLLPDKIQDTMNRFPRPSEQSTASLEKRDPAPVIFQMGRKKGFYELNGEKHTDHLYDIADDNAVGKAVIEKSGAVIDDIWRNWKTPQKDGVKCSC